MSGCRCCVDVIDDAHAMLADSVQSADDAVVEGLRPILARIEVLDLSCEDVRLQDAVNLMLFCATASSAG